MSGTCKDCRWWGEPDYGRDRACVLISEAVDFPAFLVADTEEAEAIIYTAPDFGCVQFEGKAD